MDSKMPHLAADVHCGDVHAQWAVGGGGAQQRGQFQIAVPMLQDSTMACRFSVRSIRP